MYLFLAVPPGMRELSSLVRIQPVPSAGAVEAWSLNHWTSREVSHASIFKKELSCFLFDCSILKCFVWFYVFALRNFSFFPQKGISEVSTC